MLGSAAGCRNAADGRKDKHLKMDGVFWFGLIAEFAELKISPPSVFWEALCRVTAPSPAPLPDRGEDAGFVPRTNWWL